MIRFRMVFEPTNLQSEGNENFQPSIVMYDFISQKCVNVEGGDKGE